MQERGFEPSMLLCKEIWALVRYHRWGYFGKNLKEPIVVPIVHEFYASFRDQESSRPYDAICEIVIVRDMDNIENYLTKCRGEWKHRPDLPPNKYGPMQFINHPRHKEKEGNDDYKEDKEEEEDREQDSQEDDDANYEVAFQLQ
ncbi:hypothetical protein PVK06_001691 [Gossypium arboreum]|uniref:Uncharacterized protein n=1 Tax=Gossypium arboreum TaxID=29729 RepID=A0ABR0R1R4_GOSAR|nr:hypothetical protein PVK06_001691 [Gossypium arboreum]